MWPKVIHTLYEGMLALRINSRVVLSNILIVHKESSLLKKVVYTAEMIVLDPSETFPNFEASSYFKTLIRALVLDSVAYIVRGRW